MTPLLLVASAAICFVAGGVCMKYADGLRHAEATAGFLLLFVLGAALQSEAMRGEDLAVMYVVGLGLEAALAVSLGLVVFGEPITVTRTCALTLVIGGVALLRAA